MKPLVTLIVGLVLTACATVPITGRSQLRFVSSQELADAAAPQYDRLIAEWRAQNRIVSSTDSPRAAQIYELAEHVSEKVIRAAGMESRHAWKVILVNAANRNAAVTPDGKITIFLGILPLARTEAGLAAIIAHEVGHVVAEHQAERLSQAILAQASLQVADIALNIAGVPYAPLLLAAIGMGARYGFLLPFSRLHELEADHLGLFFMAKAGYDPVEAIAVWQRMEAAGSPGPWDFRSTHPSPATRQEEMRGHLATARVYFENQELPLPKNLDEARRARQERDRLVADPPLALPPSFPVGYTLRFDAGLLLPTFTYRLSAVEPCRWGHCNRFLSSLGPSHLYTAEFAEAELRDGSTTVQYDPPLQLMRWPLRVGDSWSHPVTLRTRQTINDGI